MKKFWTALLALVLLTGSCCAQASGMEQAASDAVAQYNLLLPVILDRVYSEKSDELLPYFQLEFAAEISEKTGLPSYSGAQSVGSSRAYVSFISSDPESLFSDLIFICTTDDMELAAGLWYPMIIYAGLNLHLDVEEINGIKNWIATGPEIGEHTVTGRCIVERNESDSMLTFRLRVNGAGDATLAAEPEGNSLPGSSAPTTGERNALKSANQYLSFTSFSRSGLIEQLEYEGYTTQEAEYAAEHCGADWMDQARKSALSYLEVSAFSESGLIDQLEYEGFTHEQALYGVANCEADWMEQAEKSAASYLNVSSFSRSGLISQLEYEGFTHEQAVYGVEQNGY